MAVTRVAYEADGWGVGELWLENDVVVWHELPTARHATASRQSRVVDLVQAYFAGEDVDLNEVPVDLDYETDFLTKCARALRDVPRGETVTYGELAALAGAPGAAARPARSARGTGSGSSSRATASSAPAASARTARSASSTRSDC